ncbi:MAG: serine/threonine protein kinase [Pseudonocardia sp.]|nr:serine/threonine protein kinase [Pseudonocardia sp.]
MTPTDRTLRDLLRTDGRLSFDRAAQILADVARALAPVHATGQAHGAITPQSVHLDAEGGARLGPPATDASTTGLLPPAYLAPERIAGDPADPRSDVYALGLLGWEMLTGQTPWVGDSLEDVVLHQRSRDLPRLTTVRPGVPRPLLLAIEGALHKQPSDRWASAGELLGELGGDEPAAASPSPIAVDAVPVAAPAATDRPTVLQPPPSTRVHPPGHLGRRVAVVALVVAVLVSGAAALMSLQGRSKAQASAPWMDSLVTSTSAGVVITNDTTHGSAAPVHGNRARPSADVAPSAAYAAPAAGNPVDQLRVDDEADRLARQRADSAADEPRDRAAALPHPDSTAAPVDSTRRAAPDSSRPRPAVPDSARRPAVKPDSVKPDTNVVRER